MHVGGQYARLCRELTAASDPAANILLRARLSLSHLIGALVVWHRVAAVHLHHAIRGHAQQRPNHAVLLLVAPDEGVADLQQDDGVHLDTHARPAHRQEQRGHHLARLFTAPHSWSLVAANCWGARGEGALYLSRARAGGSGGWRAHFGPLDKASATSKRAGAPKRSFPKPEKKQFLVVLVV